MFNKPTVHIVSHTHWDPEWYSPFREYQMRLVPLVDKMLNILENNRKYQYFMFDGQISALLNYLEIKPYNRNRIENLVKSGRLLVGPFYILPDEYMVSPEGILRNLLWGIRESKQFGGYMPVAYLCDMAGHPSQMPQVLNQFNIDTMVAWRGVLGSPGLTKSEFIWKAPDGSKILFLVMPFAYVNFGRLPDDRTETLQIAKNNIKRLLTFASTSNLLLMEGYDHQVPREDIPDLIEYLNANLPEYKFVHSNLVNYAQSVKEELTSDVYEYQGELRATQTSFILPGILSTRLPLKKEIRKGEFFLERLAEPLASLADMMGLDSYPKDFLDLAWRIQFNNQFHDVIYGAHVDEVTEEATSRAHQVLQISKRVAYGSAYLLAKECSRGYEKNIVLINPTPYFLSGTFDFTLRLSLYDSIYNYILLDENDKPIPFGVEKLQSVRNYLSDRKLIDYAGKGEDIQELSIFAQIDNIPPFGFKVIGIDKVQNTAMGKRLKEQEEITGDFMNIFPSLKLEVKNPVYSGVDFMENAFLKISFSPDGTIVLEDKEGGKIYRNFGFIEDSGDRGDQYLFSPPERNAIVYPSYTELRKIVSSPLKTIFEVNHCLEIPLGITDDRTARSLEAIHQEVKVTYTLRANTKFLEVKVQMVNRAGNHRLRMGFEVGKEMVFSEAEVFFDVIKRSSHKELDDTFWPEKASLTKPKDRFVFVGNKDEGLIFVDQGWLKEYEFNESGYFFLTILRCNDFLSVELLPERSGSSTGPKIATPGSQYLGAAIEADFAIYPLSKHWAELPSFSFADHLLKPLDFQILGKYGGKINSEESLLSFSSEKILISALKRKEDGNGWIIRVWNPLDEEQRVKAKISHLLKIKEVFQVNGLEERIKPINLEDGEFVLEFGPKKILSLELSLGEFV